MKDTIELEPQQKCQKRERKQIQQMKRATNGSDIQNSQRRKDFGKPSF